MLIMHTLAQCHQFEILRRVQSKRGVLKDLQTTDRQHERQRPFMRPIKAQIPKHWHRQCKNNDIGHDVNGSVYSNNFCESIHLA